MNSAILCYLFNHVALISILSILNDDLMFQQALVALGLFHKVIVFFVQPAKHFSCIFCHDVCLICIPSDGCIHVESLPSAVNSSLIQSKISDQTCKQ